MKFTISKQELEGVIERTGKVVVPRSTGMYDSYLFQIKEGVLTVTTTDGLVVIKDTVKVEVLLDDGKDTFLIPSFAIRSSIHELPDGQLAIETENDTLSITWSNGCMKTGITPDENIPYPKVSESWGCTMPSDSFTKIVKDVVYAAADDELRPILTGVFFEITNNRVIAVASDSRTLSVSDCEGTNGAEKKFILPAKVAKLVSQLIVEPSSMGIIIDDEKNNIQLTINNGRTVLSSKLISGNFPQYNSVIPKNSLVVATVDRKNLMQILKRALAYESLSDMGVIISVSDDKIVIYRNGEGKKHKMFEEALPAETSGGLFEIKFDNARLLESLSHYSEETLQLNFTEQTRPLLIKTTDGTGIETIVMPLCM